MGYRVLFEELMIPRLQGKVMVVGVGGGVGETVDVELDLGSPREWVREGAHFLPHKL